MSAHDYMSRSDYAGDAYPDHVSKFPYDADGKSWSVTSYGRGFGTRKYVRQVSSYEIHEGRTASASTAATAYSSSFTKGFPSKGSQSNNNDGRPLEVHEFLTKILTKVNGSPGNTSGPNPGTNQDGNNYSHEPPSRTRGAHPGGIHSSFHTNPKRVDVQEADLRYGTSPRNTDPTSGPFARVGDSNLGRDRYSFPVKEEFIDDYGPNHRYGSSPTPSKVEPRMGYGYDYNYSYSPVKSENHQWGRPSSPAYDPRPRGGHGVPNRQGGGYGLDSEAPKSSSPIYDHPPQRNYQLRDDQWGTPLKSETRDYGVGGNPSPRKPNSSKDHEVQNNGWGGGSSVKSHTPNGFGVSPESIYAAKTERPNEYEIPDSRWGNIETRDYGIPSNKLDKSSVHDHPRDDPKKQCGGSTMSPRGYGVSSNEWDNSSRPNYNHPGNNLSHPGNNPSSPKNQRGISSVKTHSPGNYGVPNNQQDRLLSPAYNHIQNSPSSPKNQLRDHPSKTDSPRAYGLPRNAWDRSSSPVYDHPRNNPSSPKNNQWGNSPMKPRPPSDYGVPTNGQSEPSNRVYDNSWNNQSGPKHQGYGFSSPVYDHPPNDEHYKPAEVTCKDGVCTLNDKPKAPQGTHDEPKGTFPAIKPYSPDQYETEGLKSNPYSPDHHPKDFGKGTNQMKPSGYNLGENLEQLNLGREAPLPEIAPPPAGKPSTPTASLLGSRQLTVPPPLGLVRESMAGREDIDSREAARRYGGHNIPENSYASGEDQNRTITSQEALEKYSGSFVPKPKVNT